MADARWGRAKSQWCRGPKWVPRRKDAGVQSKMPKAGSRWRFEQLLVVDGKADLKIAAISERKWILINWQKDVSDFNDFR